MKIIPGLRRLHYATKVGILVTVALITGMAISFYITPTPPTSPNPEIRTWYDLDAVRHNLAGNYTLMNNLDSTIPGYEKLASPTANRRKGWKPIGTPPYSAFNGIFDGQGYEIRDLFIKRPDEDEVGLFSFVGYGVIKDIGVVNATVTGEDFVGGLVGSNFGNVSNSYSSGSVTGDEVVGGLVGDNSGTVNDSYSTGSVTGDGSVGALVGANGASCEGTVSNSYATGTVTGDSYVGGLVGQNPTEGAVSNSYATGTVTGDSCVGGLVGLNDGTVSNSYATGSATGDGGVGGLVGASFGTVSNSFWDIEASGQATSAGGIGKNTTEMQNIITFSGAMWDIIAVTPGSTNNTYIWNIVNNVTYPFLSWQS